MLPTRRRYYLSKLRLAQAAGDDGAEALCRALHAAAEPATPLPVNTPGLTRLQAAEYTCVEDVQGARLDELTGLGLQPTEARALFALYSADFYPPGFPG